MQISEENTVRVLLLGAGFGTNNMGVGALTSGAIRSLRADGRQTEIALLDYGTEDEVKTTDSNGCEMSIPIVAMRWSWKLYLGNNIIVLVVLAGAIRLLRSGSLRNWILARNKCLRQICEADIAAAVSGGDSFSDIYGLGRLLYVCLPQLLVLLLNKRLILLPQTLGPFSGRMSRWTARVILRNAERVYSRDHSGLELIRQLVGGDFDTARHCFCYDLGFVVQPRRPTKVEIAGLDQEFLSNPPLVGLNVSGLLWVGGYAHKSNFNLKSDYRQTVRAAINRLITGHGAQILLVPHVFGTESGSESDVLACEQLYRELGGQYEGSLGIARSNLDQSEVKYLIGSCDFFIGSRMHACIAALSQQIPAVSIAYSDKFIGVLDAIGVPTLVADARKLTGEQIVTLIDNAYSRRHELARQLSQQMPNIQSTVLALCDEIPGMESPVNCNYAPVLSSI